MAGEGARPNANGRPVRVAVLDHTADLGGAELALVRLLDALPAGGFDVRVVLFADGPLVARLAEAGHAVEVLPLAGDLSATTRHEAAGPVRAVRSALRVLPYAVRLARRLRALDVDVVHTTSLKADLVGVPAAALARRPLVWHIHDRIAADYLPGVLVRVIRLLARTVPRRVIANSLATAATLPGARGLVVAHPGVAPEQVRPGPRTAAPGRPVVGILGRLSETKGQLEFVRAAALVLREVPEARFRIVGAPLFGQEAYEQQLRAEVVALGLSDRVELVGFAEDPGAELDRMTVCVHASGTPEPFGQVVVEAMVRGVPVVATRGGGVTEIVEPPEVAPLGLLVPPQDVPALAAAVTACLTDGAGREERAARAYAYAAEHFTVARTAAVVARVWRELGSAGRELPSGSRATR